VRAYVLAFATAVAACHPGGEYAGSARQHGVEVDRGETNGRMFDFVSNKPDGDDWQIRIRGSGMWVSYAREDSSDPLGSINLSDKETRKVWKLIDELDISGRKKGKKDEDEGYVTLRLREPGAHEEFDISTVYVSRATEDEDVISLASYLQDLVKKYKKEKPNF
jgi:hypothetical protein